jgi:hypothetical protein
MRSIRDHKIELNPVVKRTRLRRYPGWTVRHSPWSAYEGDQR